MTKKLCMTQDKKATRKMFKPFCHLSRKVCIEEVAQDGPRLIILTPFS
jgi:hypothetical protein